MRRTFLLAIVFGLPVLAAEPLASRIGHTDPSKYRRSRSHGSAGDMACETLYLEARWLRICSSCTAARLCPAVEWGITFTTPTRKCS